jgi:hypothetical protein
MFVLEPFGLRLARWDVPEKMQGLKITTKNRLQCPPDKKQGRPEFPNGLALRLFQRVVSVLCRSPPAGLIFSLNHRPFRALDEFDDCIIFCSSLCKWNQTLADAFSNAVASLQQYLPVVMAEPKNSLCRKNR